MEHGVAEGALGAELAHGHLSRLNLPRAFDGIYI